MNETALADAWVSDQLERAREAFRQRPPGPHDLTLQEYEQTLRAQAEAILRPTHHYIGVSVELARASAEAHGDTLCVHRGQTGHRADWRSDRVHVELDGDDQVLAAHRDNPPWRPRG